MSDELQQLLDAKALGQLLGFSAEWVRDQRRKHGWPCIGFDRNIRFTPEQVNAILQLHEIEARKPAPRTRRIHHRRTK